MDDLRRARWREQAFEGVRTALDQWKDRRDNSNPGDQAAMQKTLEHWQRDPDLASLRDADAIGMLPAAEQARWHKLWADVATLLSTTPAPTDPSSP